MVDKAGDWKLMGFEVSGNIAEFEAHLQQRVHLLDALLAAPEVVRPDLSVIRTSATHTVDAYAYGKLISVVIGQSVPPVRDICPSCPLLPDF
jgi:hypothetical protein